MKNRKKRNKIYLYLLVILGLTVGFALLSTTLNINGTAGIKKNTWDIHWDKNSIQVTENSVQAETPTVTEDGQKVSYEVTLELPGDFYEFTIDAVNAGTIDGMVNIGGLTPTIKNKTTGEVTTLPSYIKYSVTYADGSPIEEFHKLAKRVDADTPTREKFKIRIEYDSNSKELSDDDKEFEIDDDLPYIPDDGRGKDRKDGRTVYINHLGKSETLDPTWKHYFKVKLNEITTTNDIYTIFGEDAGETVDLYSMIGWKFSSLQECNSFKEYVYGTDSSVSCDVIFQSGTKHTIVEDVDGCILMKDGKEFCYDYNKFDCDFDESIGECKNSSTYALQKKNEALSRNGYYTASRRTLDNTFGTVFYNGNIGTDFDTTTADAFINIENGPSFYSGGADMLAMIIDARYDEGAYSCYYMGNVNQMVQFDTVDVETKVTCKED